MIAQLFFIGIFLYTLSLSGNTLWDTHFLTHQGVRITDFMQESPARNAGLAINNTITSIDNTPITTSRDFITALANKKPGDIITVQTTTTIHTVTLGQEPIRNSARLGIHVENIQQQKTNLPQHLDFTITTLLTFLYWLGIAHIIAGIAILRTTAWTEIILLNALNILDIITTNSFLALGKTEGNPFGLYLMETLGLNTTLLLKIIIVFTGSLILAWLSHKKWKTEPLTTITKKRLHLKGAILVYLFAVLINIRVLI